MSEAGGEASGGWRVSAVTPVVGRQSPGPGRAPGLEATPSSGGRARGASHRAGAAGIPVEFTAGEDAPCGGGAWCVLGGRGLRTDRGRPGVARGSVSPL